MCLFRVGDAGRGVLPAGGPPHWPGGKVTASRAAQMASIPAFAVDLLPGPVIPVTLKVGTAVATLPGAWCYRVGVGTGWPRVSIL